ncbi:MAG: dUTP diphosphatase [Patescibacteria group bacterium]
MQLKVKKLNSEAILPRYAHPEDAGMDFFNLEKVTFLPGEQKRVFSGVAIEIPEGYVGLIWDKSGISFKLGLKVMGGVIDSGYRGEIIFCFLNTSNKEVVLEKGQKVAQMIIQKFEHCEIQEVFELSDTARGEKREGSTGDK